MKFTIGAVLFCAFTAFAVQDTKPEPVRISATDAARLLLKAAAVVFPENGGDLRGFVTAELHIGIDGIVSNVEVFFADPGLAQAVAVTFRQYRFKPYLLDGKPAEFLISAHAIFRGRNSTPESSLTPMRIRVSHKIMEGNQIRYVPAQYPDVARPAHIQGDVVLQAIISDQGKIDGVTIVSGHPLLTPAAIDAVKQWRYYPYLLNNQAVEVETVVTIQFRE